MFGAWTIIDSLLTNATTGHQYWEPKALIEELRREGKEARLIGHTSLQADDFPDARCLPAFPLYYAEQMAPDPAWSYIENFIVHNRSYEETLVGVDGALFQDSLILFPNVCVRHLLGIFRWLSRYDDRTRPKSALILGALDDWSASNPEIEAYRKVWGSRPLGAMHDIALCARTEATAGKFDECLGVNLHVLPSPLGPTQRETEAADGRVSSQEPMIVSFLGGARPERGATLVPEIVKYSEPLGVRFFVQVVDAYRLGFRVAALKALRERPNVRLHEGTLARAEYNDWIARSVVLLPYDREAYRWRSSGVYLEAKCFGTPVIVPEGTWMAEDVRRCGNGVIFDDYSGPAVARSIAAAQADLPNLRVRAKSCAGDFCLQHGADRFIGKVESLLG